MPRSCFDVKIIYIHQVGRHQSAVEQHRKEYEKGNCSAVRQFFNRKRIRQKRGHRNICSRTNDRYKNGDSVCSQNFLALADDIGVSIEAEFLREERISVADQCVFIGQRGNKYEYKRQYNG